MRLLWVGLLAGLVAAPLWSNEVYRSVDAQGNVRYSDRPEGENVEKVVIILPRNGAASAGRPPAGTDAAPAAPAPAAAPGASDAPSPEAVAEERARNCELARERLERYSVSQRLYRTLPDGEREYLNDAETDDARARAAAEVQRWCGA